MKLHDVSPFDLYQLESLFREKGIPTNWKDALMVYASDFDARSGLLVSLLQQLSMGRELSAEQLEAVLNARNIPCDEEQVRSAMEFLTAAPLSVVRRNEKGRFTLCASIEIVARKLQVIKTRIEPASS